MIDKTGGRRGPRRAAAVAAVAGIAVLTGCSTSPVSSGGTASAHPVTYQENLAFSHCMQTHGVPSFPDPQPDGAIVAPPESVRNTAAYQGAYNECKSKLPNGGAGLQG